MTEEEEEEEDEPKSSEPEVWERTKTRLRVGV
jgi:hypothetical protein